MGNSGRYTDERLLADIRSQVRIAENYLTSERAPNDLKKFVRDCLHEASSVLRIFERHSGNLLRAHAISETYAKEQATALKIIAAGDGGDGHDNE